VVVDFHKKRLPVGPPPEMKLSQAEVVEELKQAGFRLEKQLSFLPYQYYLVFTRRFFSKKSLKARGSSSSSSASLRLPYVRDLTRPEARAQLNLPRRAQADNRARAIPRVHPPAGEPG
jgi:hypothetical protein